MATDDKTFPTLESVNDLPYSPGSPSHLTHFKPLTPDQDEPPFKSAYSSFVNLFRFTKGTCKLCFMVSFLHYERGFTVICDSKSASLYLVISRAVEILLVPKPKTSVFLFPFSSLEEEVGSFAPLSIHVASSEA